MWQKSKSSHGFNVIWFSGLAVAVSEHNVPKCSKRIFKKLCMCDLPNWFEAAFKTTSCTQIKKGSEKISAFQSQYTQISVLWRSKWQNCMTHTITQQVQLDLGVLFCFVFSSLVSTTKFWLAECLSLAHRGSRLCDYELRAAIWCRTDSDAERFSHNRCLDGGDTCTDITNWGEWLF